MVWWMLQPLGTEVLYRKDLSEEELLTYIAEVKEALPDIPVGYVDAYYEFVTRPAIADACDIILTNCYPYWEGTPIEYGYDHMRHMFDLAAQAGKGKPVMITETGWPSQGEALAERFLRTQCIDYFIITQLWRPRQTYRYSYFARLMKTGRRCRGIEVGAYWGIWDSKGTLNSKPAQCFGQLIYPLPEYKAMLN